MAQKDVTIPQVFNLRDMANAKQVGRERFQHNLDDGTFAAVLDSLKGANWEVVRRIFNGNAFLWALLGLERTAHQVGFQETDFRKLALDKKQLKQILQVVRVQAEVVELVVDLDADPPSLSDGWEVAEHRKGGVIKFDLARLGLYLSPNHPQEWGKHLHGEEFRRELESQPVLNANMMNFLLKRPHLIPKEWDGNVFFWGTIYRCRGALYVPCMSCSHYFSEKIWNRGLVRHLGDAWFSCDSAAILVG